MSHFQSRLFIQFSKIVLSRDQLYVNQQNLSNALNSKGGVFYIFVSLQGYQEFAGMESSVTTKVKGYSESTLGLKLSSLPPTLRQMYERVWDEADYVVPPAENGAFFVTTNVVITPNQTLGYCPEVRYETRQVSGVKLQYSKTECWMDKFH